MAEDKSSESPLALAEDDMFRPHLSCQKLLLVQGVDGLDDLIEDLQGFLLLYFFWFDKVEERIFEGFGDEPDNGGIVDFFFPSQQVLGEDHRFEISHGTFIKL